MVIVLIFTFLDMFFLGGYGRHRTAFEKGGFEGVVNELTMELGRIGLRNFGRDDRVVSSNGKNAL